MLSKMPSVFVNHATGVGTTFQELKVLSKCRFFVTRNLACGLSSLGPGCVQRGGSPLKEFCTHIVFWPDTCLVELVKSYVQFQKSYVQFPKSCVQFQSLMFR